MTSGAEFIRCGFLVVQHDGLNTSTPYDKMYTKDWYVFRELSNLRGI